MSWTQGWSDEKSRMQIISPCSDPVPYIQVVYKHTSYDGIVSDLDYKIQLTTTPCNFGGQRYWFICPLIKNDIPCNCRVGVLYAAGKYLGCRKCHDLAYLTQQEDYSSKWHYLGMTLFSKLDGKEAAMRVKFWKGRPTKRYQRLLKKMEKMPSLQDVYAIIESIHKNLRG